LDHGNFVQWEVGDICRVTEASRFVKVVVINFKLWKLCTIEFG